MDIIQIVLLAIFTFILAIDQFSLTEVIQRPIIACTVYGLILGDLKTGLLIGGTYELMMVGSMPVGGAQPPNAIIGGVVSTIFAVKSGMEPTAALGAAIIFSTFGQYIVTATFTFCSGLMKLGDEAAAKADTKAIGRILVIESCILGVTFALIAVLAYTAGVSIADGLKEFSKNPWFSTILGGLGAAGGMMRYVGFAVLLKIMLANDMWGIYLAGFASAAILGNIPQTSGATLILVAFIGVAIAMYDYNTAIKYKNNGGVSDGI